jgi:uncharacterized membrane protein YqjE
MDDNNHQGPGLGTLVSKIARTGLGALQNRGELLSVEWQEEKARMMELLIWVVGFLFLGIMGTMMLTGFIILLFREDLRLYAAAGFALLYLAGAVAAWMSFTSLLKHEPFTESISQVKKDASWFDSLK